MLFLRGSLPGSGDDVTIDVSGQRTITINNTAQAVSSLINNENLIIDGGSGSLTVGAGGFLQAGISTDVDAINGGTFTLNATDYTATTAFVTNVLRAGEASSLVDFSSVLTLSGNTAASTALIFEAINAGGGGGKVDLSSVAAISTGKVRFLAFGPGSLIDASSLASFSKTGSGAASMDAMNGGQILAPNLTSLDNIGLTLDATGIMNTSQISSYTNGTATMDGATPDLSGITNADGAGFVATGGATIDLSGLTDYNASTAFVATSLKADGANSELLMTDVSTITGNTAASVRTVIEALDGGLVDFQSVTAIDDGKFNITADGANSMIDLSSLEDAESIGNVDSTIKASNGGIIDSGNIVTALTNIDIELTPTGNVSGGTVQLLSSGVTDPTSAELFGNGTLSADLNNTSGTVSPGMSHGDIIIDGDFEQELDGTLVIEIFNSSDFDTLTVTGLATLGGVLDVVLDPAFDLTLGDEFPFLIGNNVGNFLGLPDGALVLQDNGLDLNILHQSGQVVLTTVIPEPGSVALFVLSGLCLLRRRRA